MVADIKLRLSGGAGDENSLDHKALPNRMFWIAFHGSVYPESDKHRQYAMPFAVEGRKSVERVIEFQWDAPETQLEDGHYTPPRGAGPATTLGRRRWRTTCAFPLRTDLWSGKRTGLGMRPAVCANGIAARAGCRIPTAPSGLGSSLGRG